LGSCSPSHSREVTSSARLWGPALESRRAHGGPEGLRGFIPWISPCETSCLRRERHQQGSLVGSVPRTHRLMELRIN